MARAAPAIPLDVTTYREGWLRLRGWACFTALTFLTGVLLVLYELVIINVQDRDFRDMLHDYRVTQPGIMYQHKHFVNAAFCCHDDPMVFGRACDDGDVERLYFSASQGWYQPARHPHCPPFITFTCANLYSPECRQTRAAVYAAAGLDPQTGLPAECGRAGRVRLRAMAAGSMGARSSQLGVEWQGQRQREAMVLPDNTTPNMQQLRAFVDAAALRYSDELYVMPSTPLGRALRAGGLPVALDPAVEPGAPDTNNFGWPWELWPWPPGWACANTGRPPALYLRGALAAGRLPAFVPADFMLGGAPPQLRLALYSDEVDVDLYMVRVTAADTLVVGPDGGLRMVTAAQQLASSAAAAGLDPAFASQLAAFAVAPDADVGGSLDHSGVSGGGGGGSGGGSSGGGGDGSSSARAAAEAAEVVVTALSDVTLRAGFAAVLDACSAWMLDKEWVDAAYDTVVWNGTLAEWQRMAASGGALPVRSAEVGVTLRDVSEPLPLALPRYGGNVYIYAAIVLGGVWMFSAVPLLLAGVLVGINVQRHRGLPLFIYRYMRRYRGW